MRLSKYICKYKETYGGKKKKRSEMVDFQSIAVLIFYLKQHYSYITSNEHKKLTL